MSKSRRFNAEFDGSKIANKSSYLNGTKVISSNSQMMTRVTWASCGSANGVQMFSRQEMAVWEQVRICVRQTSGKWTPYVDIASGKTTKRHCVIPMRFEVLLTEEE
jgi:hypothetical protein